MKIGISSYAFRWSVGTPDFKAVRPMTVADFFRQSKFYGAQAVQICDNLPLHVYRIGELIALRKNSKVLDLDIEIGIKGSQYEKMIQYIKICRILDSKILRIILSKNNKKLTLKELKENFNQVLDILYENEIKIAIENHFCYTPDQLIELIDSIHDERIGICLDPLNSIALLHGVEDTIKKLAPYTISVHIKDANVTRRKTGFHIEGCKLGEGLINTSKLISELKKYNNNPNLFVENWMDNLNDINDTIKQENEWVKHGVKYLSRIMK